MIEAWTRSFDGGMTFLAKREPARAGGVNRFQPKCRSASPIESFLGVAAILATRHELSSLSFRWGSERPLHGPRSRIVFLRSLPSLHQAPRRQPGTQHVPPSRFNASPTLEVAATGLPSIPSLGPGVAPFRHSMRSCVHNTLTLEKNATASPSHAS